MPAPASSSPAWTRDDLASNPHAHAEKADKVRRMFGAIARRYDLNNRLHSFGRDQAWRRAAVRIAGVRPTDEVLDAACGTGDLTRAFADAGAARVVGLDFTPEMLDIARTKTGCRGQRSAGSAERSRPWPDDADLRDAGAPVSPSSARPGGVAMSPGLAAEPARPGQPIRSIREDGIAWSPTVCIPEYIEGDATNLPFADASFDIVSIAFGIRNVADPARALREFRRVLRPGGRLIILEFGRPRFAPIAWLNDFYCSVIMPRTATLIAGDRSGAYKYLPRSITTFLTREAMTAAMADAGFSAIRSTPMTFGVCVCYRGDAPLQ